MSDIATIHNEPVYSIGVTRSEQMALIDVLIAYMRSDEPQEFVNCSSNPPKTTTTDELLRLIQDL